MAAKWMTLRAAAPLLGKTEQALQKFLQREAKKKEPGTDGRVRILIGCAAIATRVGRNWHVALLECSP